MLRVFRAIVDGLTVLFTGGKYGSSIRRDRSHDYAKAQERRQSEFQQFGSHGCKICGTRIPGNKSYCGACYHNYKK